MQGQGQQTHKQRLFRLLDLGVGPDDLLDGGDGALRLFLAGVGGGAPAPAP